MTEGDDDDGEGLAVTRLLRSIVSSEEPEIEVFVSSPDSIHFNRDIAEGIQRHAAD